MLQFDYAGKNRGTTAFQVSTVLGQLLQNPSLPESVFVWTHLMDPHARHESNVRFPESSVLDAYDNELSWVDAHLQIMFSAIHARFGTNALIIVTSDHGESFGERGSYGHGFTSHEAELRIPLILQGPKIPRAVRTDAVSALGIVPTILDLLGASPKGEVSYPSLLQPKLPPPIATIPAYLWNELRQESVLIDWPWKLSWARLQNTYLLFHLEDDPDERNNLVTTHDEIFQQLRKKLRHALAEQR